MSEVPSPFFETCDHCDARFDSGTRYPVVTGRSPDGDLQVYSFCDGDCLDNWRESR